MSTSAHSDLNFVHDHRSWHNLFSLAPEQLHTIAQLTVCRGTRFSNGPRDKCSTVYATTRGIDLLHERNSGRSDAAFSLNGLDNHSTSVAVDMFANSVDVVEGQELTKVGLR